MIYQLKWFTSQTAGYHVYFDKTTQSTSYAIELISTVEIIKPSLKFVIETTANATMLTIDSVNAYHRQSILAVGGRLGTVHYSDVSPIDQTPVGDVWAGRGQNEPTCPGEGLLQPLKFLYLGHTRASSYRLIN